MRLTTWLPAAGLALLLTACGDQAPAPHAGQATGMHRRAQGDEGKVVGSFTRVGGPLGQGGKQPPRVPLSGTLSFSVEHRRTVAVKVGTSGRYAVWLPAGDYQVSGRSPSILAVLPSGATRESPCSPEIRVTVTAGKTVRIAVVCPVP